MAESEGTSQQTSHEHGCHNRQATSTGVTTEKPRARVSQQTSHEHGCHNRQATSTGVITDKPRARVSQQTSHEHGQATSTGVTTDKPRAQVSQPGLSTRGAAVAHNLSRESQKHSPCKPICKAQKPARRSMHPYAAPPRLLHHAPARRAPTPAAPRTRMPRPHACCTTHPHAAPPRLLHHAPARRAPTPAAPRTRTPRPHACCTTHPHSARLLEQLARRAVRLACLRPLPQAVVAVPDGVDHVRVGALPRRLRHVHGRLVVRQRAAPVGHALACQGSAGQQPCAHRGVARRGCKQGARRSRHRLCSNRGYRVQGYKILNPYETLSPSGL
eukprot:365025-Chlamydomonas_euryale.AAC.18